jgi:predicted transcriptional regulator
MMQKARLTAASQYLLQQLAAPDAMIVFTCACCERFYFQCGLSHFIVQQRAVDVLTQAGMLARDRGSAVPIYRITGKGREYLRGD